MFGESLFNLGGSSSSNSAASKKPVLSPTVQKPRSVGDELLSNLLGDLDMKPSSHKPQQQQQQQPTQQQQHQKKPNYNSSFFQTPQQQAGSKQKITGDTFNDLVRSYFESIMLYSGDPNTINLNTINI